MTKYKMIISDIDGTLVPYHSHTFPNEIKNMFKKLKENGYITAVATGRDFVSIADIHKNENIDYFIGANGSFIYDLNNEKYIFNSPIDFEEFKEYRKNVLDKNMNVVETIVLSDSSNVYIEEFKDFNRNWFWEIFRPKFKPLLLAEKEIEKDKFHLITITHNNGISLYDKTKDYFQNKKDSKIQVQAWWETGFFIANKNITKAHTIKILADKLGIKMNEIIAFGDGDNDFEMIEAVGFGVAMENAIDKLKEIADDVTDHVDNFGVKLFLEKKGII